MISGNITFINDYYNPSGDMTPLIGSAKLLFTSVLVLIFSLIFQNPLTAQDKKVIELRSIPREGLLLNKGWKHQVGDQKDWADPNFNDDDWGSIDPVVDIHELPVLWKKSIVWFRLHLYIDSSLSGDLAMTVAHAGASEFYLDGKLIRRFGVISSKPEEIIAYNPNWEFPNAFPIIRPGLHVLAVRYSLEPDIFYSTEWNNSNVGLRVTVNSFRNAQQNYYNDVIYNEKSSAFRVSAYLLLTVIFLAFYISNRKLKTNLLFFIYALAWTLVWKGFDWVPPTVKHYYYIANASLILQLFAWFIYLTAFYNLFGQRKNWTFYFLIVFGLLCIPLGMFVYSGGWEVYAVMFITLADAEILRISILSLRRGVKGAGIIVMGAAICLVMWALFNVPIILNTTFFGINPWVFFNTHHLSIPVAVTIYLGYNLGLINRSLENKLDEIKILSTEKEQILTSQKELLEEQVTQRTSELQNTIRELKSTQSQLIQSEKMASLGELTAGIAHEIQNPLNFVNNFSEINRELLHELKNGEEDLVNTILENNEKILWHGKRADAIVKAMLQHSHSGSGTKELTDINKLAEEYLRLAFHGMRAKDKSFSSEYHFTPDLNLNNIKVVPQDIGRVLLNLINNAFYAVREKASAGDPTYRPCVEVFTAREEGKIVITVKDNGTGIPLKILDKIFQPFFTTKPTGQGTGLGLSLAYDTITKGHGGELRVETEPEKGTTFIITLPVT